MKLINHKSYVIHFTKICHLHMKNFHVQICLFFYFLLRSFKLLIHFLPATSFRASSSLFRFLSQLSYANMHHLGIIATTFRIFGSVRCSSVLLQLRSMQATSIEVHFDPPIFWGLQTFFILRYVRLDVRQGKYDNKIDGY